MRIRTQSSYKWLLSVLHLYKTSSVFKRLGIRGFLTDITVNTPLECCALSAQSPVLLQPHASLALLAPYLYWKLHLSASLPLQLHRSLLMRESDFLLLVTLLLPTTHSQSIRMRFLTLWLHNPMYLPYSIPLWEMRCTYILSSFSAVFLFKINLAFGNCSLLSSPLLVSQLWTWKVDTIRQENTNSTQLRTPPKT